MTQLPLARKPYSRVQDNGISPEVNRELAKIESQQLGLFVPRVLVFGMNATAYTVKGTDWLLLCDCTGGAITVTFPAAKTSDGLCVMVIKTDASANAVTLSGTFNGVVNPTLTKQYQSKTINAGNGSYYFVPTLTAADILPGTFPGNYVISGTLEVDGNFSVNTTKFTVTASSGNTSVAGTLSVTGDVAVNTNKFTVTASSGNTLVAGTFDSTGLGTFAAGVKITGGSAAAQRITYDATFGVRYSGGVGSSYDTGLWDRLGTSLAIGVQSGTVDLQTGGKLAVLGNFSVNTSKFTVTASSGDTAIAGALSVTGATTTSRLGVGGAAVGTGSNYINFPSGGGNFAVNNADRIAIATDVLIKGTTGGVIKIANGSASGIITAENDTSTVILGTMASTNATAGNLCVSSSSAPTGNPTGGGFIWYEAGVGFRARGAGGTITTFAPA